MFAELEDIIVPTANSCKSWILDGTYPTYVLLNHILTQTGPADIKFTSFSFSEPGIRHIIHLKEVGLVGKVKAIFDHSLLKTRTPLIEFAKEVFDYFGLAQNHSKFFLLFAEGNPVTIITSANLSRKKRIETFTIDTTRETFKNFNNVFEHIITDAIIP